MATALPKPPAIFAIAIAIAILAAYILAAPAFQVWVIMYFPGAHADPFSPFPPSLIPSPMETFSEHLMRPLYWASQ